MTPISLSEDKTFAWWLKAVHQLGFPIVVAGILLYVVLSGLVQNVVVTTTRVMATEQKLDAHMAMAASAVERISNETKMSSDRLTRVMQQICVNTAATNDERRGCFPQ